MEILTPKELQPIIVEKKKEFIMNSLKDHGFATLYTNGLIESTVREIIKEFNDHGYVVQRFVDSTSFRDEFRIGTLPWLTGSGLKMETVTGDEPDIIRS